jgi:hypothetical protein
VPAGLFQDFSNRGLNTGFTAVPPTFGEKVFVFDAVMNEADLLRFEDDRTGAFDKLVCIELEWGELALHSEFEKISK